MHIPRLSLTSSTSHDTWAANITGIIASKRCNNVKIYDNEVFDGGPEAVGIFLHRSSNDCEVYGESAVDCDRIRNHFFCSNWTTLK